ncbi:glycerophosphoryl diester phosphodiesterase membrane domain-containing protein [Agromyces aureus]|uniref:DUF7847 domain-containing protein n=1 Tax=Agromyces aureus TaxID=453304 RepID=A0A191WHJ5_9MICO|nr:glycerophosphoryl diester phosphodiesterase membrane domain-containing protein [Agromyces aureus]ANJ27648.1 hypothetical protein ATC03_13960 [Agromyces aureus]
MAEHDWRAPGAPEPQPDASAPSVPSTPGASDAPAATAPAAPVPPLPPLYGAPAAPPVYGAPPAYGAPTAPPPYGAPQYGAPQYGAPAGSQAWTAPPKPGLLPLRPLGFGTLLWAPFRTLRRNPAATFGSGLLVQLAAGILAAAVAVPVFIWFFGRLDSAGPAEIDELLPGSIAALVLTMLFAVGVSVVASAFLQGVMIVEVASGTLGEKLSLGALWRRTLPRIGALVVWTLLVTLALLVVLAVLVGIIVLGAVTSPVGLGVSIAVVVLLSLGLVVLGWWIGVRLALVPSIIVLEHAGIATAMRRSWRLTIGYFWRTLGVLLLVSVILNVASQVVVQPVTLLGGLLPAIIDPTNTGSAVTIAIVLGVVSTVLSIIITAITTVVQAALVGVVYIDLRMRTEGLDLELARHVELRDAGQPVSDPWVAPDQGAQHPVPSGGAPA